jgi:hypothetical protein
MCVVHGMGALCEGVLYVVTVIIVSTEAQLNDT